MNGELLIEESPVEIRAALVSDAGLIRPWFESDAEGEGAYLGRVRTIDRKLQAAFVDYGAARDGFLPLAERHDLAEGQEVIVTVRRPATTTKGAVLTSQIPKTQLAPLKQKAQRASAPARLDDEAHPAIAALRQAVNAGVSRITVAGSESFLALQHDLQGRDGPELVASAEPGLFEQRGIDQALEAALQRHVALPEGGRLIIDEAAALTAIDVDIAATPGQSRRGSIIRAATNAVPVIIRQLALRRIGGQVVIDFPALAVKGGGQLQTELKAEIRKLPGARLGRIDDNGLAVLILPRRQPSLLDLLTEETGDDPVPGRRLTARAIAADALRAAALRLARQSSARFDIAAQAEIVELINRNPDWLAQLATRFGARCSISVAEGAPRARFDIRELR